jgi:hypothetical protein
LLVVKPPICEVCGQEFDTTVGALIGFSPTPDELARKVDMSGTRMVGHPPATGWFCDRHADPAAQLLHLTISEAIARVRLLTDGVELTLSPTEPAALARRVITGLGTLIDPPPTLERSQHRNWTPMDRVEPPWCPYDDTFRWRGQNDAWDVEVTYRMIHWNDTELSGADFMASATSATAWWRVTSSCSSPGGLQAPIGMVQARTSDAIYLDRLGSVLNS